jgi:hypothetical protein
MELFIFIFIFIYIYLYFCYIFISMTAFDNLTKIKYELTSMKIQEECKNELYFFFLNEST